MTGILTLGGIKYAMMQLSNERIYKLVTPITTTSVKANGGDVLNKILYTMHSIKHRNFRLLSLIFSLEDAFQFKELSL